MSEEKKEAYRVLARKYRPLNFDELIGQEALVRTLSNAIESGRIAHAFMLTGVRGVGKTTTARIIAKALNYRGPDGDSGPTIGPTDDCEICRAISEDRHPDVIEMDAASRTGVDDIREILDGVRYAPTEARYKVYVIDEVHMLSKNAFNALLKTLEEPPEHVKFIFATTEIRKVPITVLSRCQRFDLRRVDVPALSQHFLCICEKEGVACEEEAITLISRAADGSVRDGLSILDRAISLCGDDGIKAELVSDMLGLADRARNLDLLEHVLSGRMAEGLSILEDMYANGADPVQVVQDLLDLTHVLTKLRAVPGANLSGHAFAADEMSRAAEMAKGLSMPTLSKTWQIMLKGLSEVQAAPNPQGAAEMVLIRLGYAADLPDPADLVKRLKDGVAVSSGGPSPSGVAHGSSGVTAMSSHSAHSGMAGNTLPQGGGDGVRAALAVVPDAPAPVTHIQKLEDVHDILYQANEVVLASNVFQYVHLLKLENRGNSGRLEVALAEGAPPRFSQELGPALSRVSGQRWIVSVVNSTGQPTLAQVELARQEKEKADILALPIMKEILEVFPDAIYKGVSVIEEKKDETGNV
tara:strand:+ start:16924 stop:18672 length:1749 start_codon:yes stop_codon:yes gene_type:complete